MKWNESGFRPPLCTYRLNWARRTSWGWWDDWDDTALQTQDSKFDPRRSEAEHATSRSRRLPTILTFTRGWGRNIFVSFKPPRPGTEPRSLAWRAAVLTTTLGPPPSRLNKANVSWIDQPIHKLLKCMVIVLHGRTTNIVSQRFLCFLREIYHPQKSLWMRERGCLTNVQGIWFGPYFFTHLKLIHHSHRLETDIKLATWWHTWWRCFCLGLHLRVLYPSCYTVNCCHRAPPWACPRCQV